MSGDQEKMLDEILESENGMSGWDMDFIENLNSVWRDRSLSDSQIEHLERIWGNTNA